jgi:hypothetical protein
MEWMDSADRFVGFFDIMGFKNYVFRNKHTIAKKRLTKLHEIVSDVNAYYKSVDINTKSSVKIGIFSDSIFLTTRTSSPHDAEDILTCSAWVLAECMRQEIPIKGALSYGQITADFDKSIFFGKALIDAYLLQDELHMYGCVVDEKFEKKIKGMDCQQEAFLIRDKIPFKGGPVRHYAVNWTDPFIRAGESNEGIKDIVEQFYHSVSGSTRKYVDNTLDFVDRLENK